MKICALTMVYRDHWALSRWFAHHAALLGAENLFIVAHGADAAIARIAPGASILTVPRDDLSAFDRRRASMLDGFHTGLAQVYDWVIRTDADELVCFDPDRHDSLYALFAVQQDPVLTALGFDVVEIPGDPTLRDGAVLGQRRNIGFSGHYSKAVAARRPVSFVLHGTRVAARRVETFPFCMPRGLYLAHLKYASGAALEKATRIRMQVGNMSAKGVPGPGWKEAEADAARFHDAFAAKPCRDWQEAETAAYETLSVKPTRNADRNLVKARGLKLPVRTVLPDRFFGQG